MPIETQTRELLHRAADEIDMAPPPLDRLLGSAARRRRRWAIGVAGVAAAAVVVAVAVMAGPGGGAAPVDRTNPPMPSDLDVPAGMRLVGQGRIAVAVPSTWATNQWGCGGMPSTETVMFEPEYVTACGTFPQPVYSALHFDELAQVSNRSRRWLSRASDTSLASGVDAYRVPTIGLMCTAASCRSTYRGGIVQPSAGLVMWVSSADESVVNEVLDSARVIPDDAVIVPELTTPEQLTDLGVDVNVAVDQPGDQPTPENRQLTDPPPGSVVAAGTSVTFFTSGTATENGVFVTEAHADCGPTDARIVVATAWSEQAATVVLALVDDGEVVGRSDPQQLAASTPTKLSVTLGKPVPDGYVTLRVRAWNDGYAPILGWYDDINVTAPGVTICG